MKVKVPPLDRPPGTADRPRCLWCDRPLRPVLERLWQAFDEDGQAVGQASPYRTEAPGHYDERGEWVKDGTVRVVNQRWTGKWQGWTHYEGSETRALCTNECAAKFGACMARGGRRIGRDGATVGRVDDEAGALRRLVES